MNSRVKDLKTLDLSLFFTKVNNRVRFHDPSKELRLKSAVVHRGNSIKSGHFVTYIFLDNGETLIMDDAVGTIVRKRQLSSQEIESLERGAYLLFYQTPISVS